jgi:K+-sensing histidine kinase KdpD
MLASFASLALVAYLDYVTGYELRFHVFYFIPISISAWHLRRRDVVGTAVIAGLAWGYVDLNSGHEYSHWGIWYWNTVISFASFLVLGLVLQRLRRNLKEQQRAREELEQALAELRQSTAEAQNLQKQLQVVCAWTHRIRIEGKWMTFEEFLRNHLHVQLSHGISPEAMEKFAREIAEQGRPPAA